MMLMGSAVSYGMFQIVSEEQPGSPLQATPRTDAEKLDCIQKRLLRIEAKLQSVDARLTPPYEDDRSMLIRECKNLLSVAAMISGNYIIMSKVFPWIDKRITNWWYSKKQMNHGKRKKQQSQVAGVTSRS